MSFVDPGDDGVAAGVDRLLADAARGGTFARRRCESVLAELALPPEHRLRDDERASIDRMAEALAAEVCRGLGGADTVGAVASAYKRDPDIIASLLRRIDEHRLTLAWSALGQSEERTEPTLLDAMLAPGDPDMLRATALLIATARRSDAFDDPIMPLADLTPSLRRRCAWIAAAHAPASADRVQPSLDGLADVPTIDAHATALAQAIEERGQLDDGLILRAFDDGSILFAIAALALRADLDFDPAWEMATGGDTLMALLRATGMERTIAAPIILGFAAAGRHPADDAAIAAQIALFDALSPDQARSIIAVYARDPDFRRALDHLR